MRIVLTTMLSISLFLGSTWAHAQPPGMSYASAEQANTVKIVTGRYGLELALADGLTMAASVASDDGRIFLAGYLLAAPGIHLAHGNPRAAGGSLALRMGLPVLGGIVGSAVGDANCKEVDEQEMFCGLGEVLLGVGVGMVTALALDYGLLARNTKRVQRPGSMFRVGSIRANPDLGVSPRGEISLGLRGSW